MCSPFTLSTKVLCICDSIRSYIFYSCKCFDKYRFNMGKNMLHFLKLFQLKEALRKCITLRRFKDGWSYCHYLNQRDCWLELGKAALYNLEIDFGK